MSAPPFQTFPNQTCGGVNSNAVVPQAGMLQTNLPMNFLGYQCDANVKQCKAVGESNYNPSNGEFFFNAQQCEAVCKKK